MMRLFEIRYYCPVIFLLSHMDRQKAIPINPRSLKMGTFAQLATNTLRPFHLKGYWGTWIFWGTLHPPPFYIFVSDDSPVHYFWFRPASLIHNFYSDPHLPLPFSGAPIPFQMEKNIRWYIKHFLNTSNLNKCNLNKHIKGHLQVGYKILVKGSL